MTENYSDVATLPLHLISRHVYEIKPGEFAYADPKIMWVDGNFRCWLYSDLEVFPSTARLDRDDFEMLLVYRDENGYHIIMHDQTPHTWPISEFAMAIPNDSLTEITQDELNTMIENGVDVQVPQEEDFEDEDFGGFVQHEENRAEDFPVRSIKIDSELWLLNFTNSASFN